MAAKYSKSSGGVLSTGTLYGDMVDQKEIFIPGSIAEVISRFGITCDEAARNFGKFTSAYNTLDVDDDGRVKCQHCGQYGEARTACEYCGAAIDA